LTPKEPEPRLHILNFDCGGSQVCLFGFHYELKLLKFCGVVLPFNFFSVYPCFHLRCLFLRLESFQSLSNFSELASFDEALRDMPMVSTVLNEDRVDAYSSVCRAYRLDDITHRYAALIIAPHKVGR